MPRPAVRTVDSPASAVNKKYQKAQRLLEQLAVHPADSPAANKLSRQLCEVLADLMLTHPDFFSQQNLADDLWKPCFYNRIRILRSKVAAEKKKGRLQASRKTQTGLNEFLAEGVTLYEYLQERLHSRLKKLCKPAKGSSISRGGSTLIPESSSSDEDDSLGGTSSSVVVSESTAGIVDCLHYCAVALGDLYRYKEQQDMAHSYYLLAARLGPGYGHAMNQLAVVLSTPDAAGSDPAAQRCVALYWYARSLSVTTPFEIARKNLKRLFDSNQVWLQEQSEDVNNNKSAQSRRFLAHFCALHGIFFQGLEADVPQQVYDQMEAFRQFLSRLLQNSALGDSLLCKMVTIQAFAECFSDRDVAAPEKRPQVDYDTGLVVRTLTLCMGTELVNRVLTTTLPKQKPSLRLLLPLLLLTEYVYTRPYPPPPTDKESLTIVERHAEAAAVFWPKIVELLNQLQPLAVQMRLDGSEEGIVLKEYQNLLGFAPFGSFIPQIPDDGVLTEEQALVVLKETLKDGGGGRSRSRANSKSQESALSSNNTVGSAASSSATTDQNRLKVARFLWLGRQLADDDSSEVGKMVHYTGQEYQWVKDQDMGEVYYDDEDEPVSTKQDVALVYEQAADGGPALLVPGSLLKEPVELVPTPAAAAAAKDLPVDMPVDNPVVMPVAPSVEMPVAPLSVVMPPGAEMTTTTPTVPTKPVLPPPPGFGNLPPVGLQQSSPFSQTPAAQPTIAESYHLFGGLQTANPFAEPPRNNTDPYNAFAQDDGVGMDGTPLLDSSLLNSLLMDDAGTPKPTKNPFAA